MDKYLKSSQKSMKAYVHIFILAIVAFSVLIFLNFYALFKSSRNNIIDSQQNDVEQSAIKTNEILSDSTKSIEITSYTINKMMLNGASSAEIHAYLVEQTDIYKNAIGMNYTGLYGVFDGEYLDGSDWVPDDDYIPESRTWYKSAIEADGEVTLISPYLDMETGSMVMSVSRMLSDGKSVISVDAVLDEIQEITKERVPKGEGNYALVLSDDGTVVAHSAQSKVGQSYLNDSGSFGSIVAKKLFETKEKTFVVQYNGVRYMVFSAPIGNDWHALTVMNENSLYGPLKGIYFIFFIVLIFFVGVISAIFIKLTQKRTEAENLNIQLRSVSAIYTTVHMINLNNDTFKEITSTPEISAMLLNGTEHAGDTLKLVMDMKTAEISKKSMETFLDLSTLDERLKVNGTVTQEFLNDNNMWFRARFVAVDYNDDKTLYRVLYMVEAIDDEKRQRDNLQYLSETDRMTGILNRGGGETKIRELIENGRGGMFCLLDADKFKSINDNYGHGVGDQVLIEIANCLKKSFRGNDVVLRLGGDEFAAYAPTVMNEKMGRPIIERFFENINQIQIKELKDRKICVSMGVAFYLSGDTYSFDELYKRADQGTYISKKHEGNYVTFEGKE
ncbi:MAG: diguanylate cyclase [Lachnospiraceae bacterium]|jgi:diguanylate cyclase (GGDEF)-like protein|nr:diguanylate cyclase [Lachnospiraceae bacterium]